MSGDIYLVTGVMGHLGNNVARKLLDDGCTVRGLALENDNAVSFDSDNFSLYRGNVCNPDSLEDFFCSKSGEKLIVIHAAGLISIASGTDKRVYAVNVEGTRNIINMCVKHSVKKLVYISSVHAIPELSGNRTIEEVSSFNPDLVDGCYAKTKAIATQEVLDAAKRGLNASVVHPSGIIGPLDYGKGHLTTLVTDYLSHKLPAAVKGGYDMVDVRDVAAAVINCARYGRSGSCYICSNRYVAIPELLMTLHNITGSKPVKTYLPLWFAKMTAPLAELFYKVFRRKPLFTAYSLRTLESNSNFSHKKAEKELGYKPRSLTDTLKDTVEWLKKQGRVSY